VCCCRRCFHGDVYLWCVCVYGDACLWCVLQALFPMVTCIYGLRYVLQALFPMVTCIYGLRYVLQALFPMVTCIYGVCVAGVVSMVTCIYGLWCVAGVVSDGDVYLWSVVCCRRCFRW